MKKHEAHIDFDLAAKVLSNEASDEEIQRFEAWLAESEANQQEFEELRQIWGAADLAAPEIDMDSAWNKIDAQIDDSKVISLSESNQKASKQIYAWAASVAAIFVLGLSIWMLFKSPSQMLAESGNAELKVNLMDGSVVTLAPNSSLTYPQVFEDGNRSVTLIGRGYFDVKSNPEKPFVVHTSDANITVLGTEFEVNAQLDSSALSVSVSEGKVKVESIQKPSETILKPMERCVVIKESGEVKKEDIHEPDAFYWMDKTIRFKRTELTEVSRILAGLFDEAIELNIAETSQCEITATFENEELQSILEVIAVTLHLKLEKSSDGYVLSGEGC